MKTGVPTARRATLRKISLGGCGFLGAFVASLATAQSDDKKKWESEVAQLVSSLDQRAVLFDGKGRGYQFDIVENEIRLFAPGDSEAPIGITTYERSIVGLNSAASSPGLRYLPSDADSLLAWYYEDGKTILLSFRLRAGLHASKTVVVDGYIYPTVYADGSIGGFSGSPWKMRFDIAKETDAGLVAVSSDAISPPGAPVYVIGSASASGSNISERTTAFANWSDSDTKFITFISSNRNRRVFRHSDLYAPLELLSGNELLMIDTSECIPKKPLEIHEFITKKMDKCSSSIIAVKLPSEDGAIDLQKKRVVRRFSAPDLLLATTSPASLSDKSSISLLGDVLFTVSRNNKGPHLDWTSIRDPSRTGRIDLGTTAGDNIAIVHRNEFSDRLQLAVDGLLSPLKFVSITGVKSGNLAPLIGDTVRIRPPTFSSAKFSVSRIESQGSSASALLVTDKSASGAKACRGRALIEVYGGYGVATHMAYLTSYGPFWLEKGNSYVAAFVRGGGDMGEHSYREGQKVHFGASVDDVISIAREVRKHGCTDVAVKGSSHGGNLAALAALKAPGIINRAIIDEAPLDLDRGLAAGSFDASIYPTFEDGAARIAFMQLASPLAALERFKAKRKPEFLLLFGGRDEIAPPYHGEAFEKAAKERGFYVEMIVDPDLAHGAPTSVEGYAKQMSSILSFANRDQ